MEVANNLTLQTLGTCKITELLDNLLMAFFEINVMFLAFALESLEANTHFD